MFKHTAAIGIDIGRFTLKVAIVNFSGEIIAFRSYPFEGSLSKDYIVTKLVSGITEIRQIVSNERINPICIGISARGFINHQDGIVIGPDHGIKGWSNVPLAKLVSRQTSLPVFVDNDANLMTIAEHKFGVARNFRNVVFVALRTGIGGGIIINDKLYRGVNNAGGEIGQMIINYTTGLSDTGIKGSFEYFSSAAALVRLYDNISGKSNLKNANPATCKDIFDLSYRNDPAAVKAVKKNATLVGIGLANLISVFAPEIIVLGGGMSEARDSYINLIRESAFANSLENCREQVRIERAQLGVNASLLGSAYYSMIRLAGKSI
jgi:glucokinase